MCEAAPSETTGTGGLLVTGISVVLVTSVETATGGGVEEAEAVVSNVAGGTSTVLAGSEVGWACFSGCVCIVEDGLMIKLVHSVHGFVTTIVVPCCTSVTVLITSAVGATAV